MKVALHVHTNRYSGCALVSPEEMIDEYINCGYGAVFLTEHDAMWTDDELNDLRGDFPEIMIFPGLELSLYQPNSFIHILILGSNDTEYLYIATPDQVIDKATEDGLLTVLAHPYRYDGADEILRRRIYPDAIELRTNAHLEKHAAIAKSFAAEHSLHLVNSDDAHRIEDIGNFWIETDRPFDTGQELREIILAAEYGCEQLG